MRLINSVLLPSIDIPNEPQCSFNCSKDILASLDFDNILSSCVDVVRAYRVLRFANIVIDKPNQEKFWLGWFRRAIEV